SALACYQRVYLVCTDGFSGNSVPLPLRGHPSAASVSLPVSVTFLSYGAAHSHSSRYIMITLADVQAARARIGGALYVSPCPYSETMSQLAQAQVFFKLDNLQMTGSFKERGALNKLLSLSTEERQCGVIAASAGNHGLAIAFHAQRLGVPA